MEKIVFNLINQPCIYWMVEKKVGKTVHNYNNDHDVLKYRSNILNCMRI